MRAGGHVWSISVKRKKDFLKFLAPGTLAVPECRIRVGWPLSTPQHDNEAWPFFLCGGNFNQRIVEQQVIGPHIETGGDVSHDLDACD